MSGSVSVVWGGSDGGELKHDHIVWRSAPPNKSSEGRFHSFLKNMVLRNPLLVMEEQPTIAAQEVYINVEHPEKRRKFQTMGSVDIMFLYMNMLRTVNSACFLEVKSSPTLEPSFSPKFLPNSSAKKALSQIATHIHFLSTFFNFDGSHASYYLLFPRADIVEIMKEYEKFEKVLKRAIKRKDRRAIEKGELLISTLPNYLENLDALKNRIDAMLRLIKISQDEIKIRSTLKRELSSDMVIRLDFLSDYCRF
ncbi:MAG: hypothetical protein D6769_00100 [Methanobacteriota archaeon]|nr:MAG: hypothetical protein D6769_00100 [Euryarchaeota archaeon]